MSQNHWSLAFPALSSRSRPRRYVEARVEGAAHARDSVAVAEHSIVPRALSREGSLNVTMYLAVWMGATVTSAVPAAWLPKESIPTVVAPDPADGPGPLDRDLVLFRHRALLSRQAGSSRGDPCHPNAPARSESG
jgi:RES domain-containing protein